MSTAAGYIDAFFVALKAEGAAIDERFEETVRRICSSEAPAAIDACDAMSAVIRRKDLSLKARAAKLLPILDTLGRALPA